MTSIATITRISPGRCSDFPGSSSRSRGAPLLPGLDVVMGTGFGIDDHRHVAGGQGQNGVPGNLFITDADLAAVNVKNGGKYVVVHTEPSVDGGRALLAGGQGGGRAVRAAVRLLRPDGARSSPVPDRRRPI